MTFLGLTLLEWVAINLAIYLSLAVVIQIAMQKSGGPQ